jgi:nitrate/nitrite transporter NarK
MLKNLSLKVILFGFIVTFFSSFGQSYFIGIFNSNIRADLSITHGQFGTIYAFATLFSSLILMWIGKKIDDMDAFKFSIFVIILLSISCYFFSTIKSISLLFIGIFLLRLSGQGLMSHTASTTVSRYFEKTRGKALSITWLGLSAAEFILPILMEICVQFKNTFFYYRTHRNSNNLNYFFIFDYQIQIQIEHYIKQIPHLISDKEYKHIHQLFKFEPIQLEKVISSLLFSIHHQKSNIHILQYYLLNNLWKLLATDGDLVLVLPPNENILPRSLGISFCITAVDI